MKKDKELFDTYQNEDTPLANEMLSEDELKLIEATRPELDRSTLPPTIIPTLPRRNGTLKKINFPSSL